MADTPTLHRPQGPRASDILRSARGAFDLPSILVGVVVVGILTAGVLASIFGVIPWAQDLGARQDLDAIRTAEGVSKVKDSRYKDSAGLEDASYLPVSDKARGATDGPGSCFVGVSRSGSGKLFYNSDSTKSPQDLNSGSNTGCITATQLNALIASVGGTPFAAAPTTGIPFTPIAAAANADDYIIEYMNADLKMNASDGFLASQDWSDFDAWMAFWDSEVRAEREDAHGVLMGSTYNIVNYNRLINRTDAGIPDLKAAVDTALGEFWAAPTAETQKAYVDAERALFAAAVTGATPPVATPSATFTPVTGPAGTEDIVRYANAKLARQAHSASLRSDIALKSGDYGTAGDLHTFLNNSPVGQEWKAAGEDPATTNTMNIKERNLMQRNDGNFPALRAAYRTASDAYFYEESTLERQQAAVDTYRALLAESLANPPATELELVAAGSTEATVLDTSMDIVTFKVYLPAGASVDPETLRGTTVGGAPGFNGTVSDVQYEGTTPYWTITMGGGEKWHVASYWATHEFHQAILLQDYDGSGLSYYKDFTIHLNHPADEE